MSHSPLKPWNTTKCYFQFSKLKELFNKVTTIDTNLIDIMIELTLNSFSKDTFELEDIAPILYIKYIIYGIEDKLPIKHIIIDEAQDFSVFQFYILKNIIQDSSFTILGDICQGIYSYRGTTNWHNIVSDVFNNKKCQILYLEQSYRTTIEIMDEANKIIKHLQNEDYILAKPVIRHGENVQYLKNDSLDSIINDIYKSITYNQKQNLKSFAIICKTLRNVKVSTMNFIKNLIILVY